MPSPVSVKETVMEEASPPCVKPMAETTIPLELPRATRLLEISVLNASLDNKRAIRKVPSLMLIGVGVGSG